MYSMTVDALSVVLLELTIVAESTIAFAFRFWLLLLVPVTTGTIFTLKIALFLSDLYGAHLNDVWS